MKYHTDDLRITGQTEVIAPEDLLTELPVSNQLSSTIVSFRSQLKQVIHLKDPRLVLVVGPCSIHDPKGGEEYAKRLAEQSKEHSGELLIVMRVYFEKPRTIVGWKGLINDPHLNDTCEINEGLKIAREFLLKVAGLGLPGGTEYLDPITPQYIGDLICWGAIGARTTESQIHRQLASGLSCPVGFKNSTQGSVQVAVDAVSSATNPHIFLGITKKGHTAIFSTAGNEDCHVILRGGVDGPNYDVDSVAGALKLMDQADQSSGVMIDMSHANSNKDYRRQMTICANLCQQIADGNRRITGAMIESNLVAGQQKLKPGQELVFGQSITDPCLSWEDTVTCIEQLAEAVKKRNANSLS